MAEIFFEDMPVEVFVDKIITNTDYDIQNDMLITRKSLEMTTSSTIYNYPDGFSLYLKFDESGSQKMIFPMLAIYSAKDEKKLVELPDTTNCKIKRYDKYFLMEMNDPEDNHGSYMFITADADGKVTKSRLNYTKLISAIVVDNKRIVLTCYETVGKSNIWTIGDYELSGKAKKILYDKRVSQINDYKTEVVILHGKKFVRVFQIRKGKVHRVVLYNMKLKATKEELEALKLAKKQQRAELLKNKKKQQTTEKKSFFQRLFGKKDKKDVKKVEQAIKLDKKTETIVEKKKSNPEAEKLVNKIAESKAKSVVSGKKTTSKKSVTATTKKASGQKKTASVTKKTQPTGAKATSKTSKSETSKKETKKTSLDKKSKPVEKEKVEAKVYSKDVTKMIELNKIEKELQNNDAGSVNNLIIDEKINYDTNLGVQESEQKEQTSEEVNE